MAILWGLEHIIHGAKAPVSVHVLTSVEFRADAATMWIPCRWNFASSPSIGLKVETAIRDDFKIIEKCLPKKSLESDAGRLKVSIIW